MASLALESQARRFLLLHFAFETKRRYTRRGQKGEEGEGGGNTKRR